MISRSIFSYLCKPPLIEILQTLKCLDRIYTINFVQKLVSSAQLSLSFVGAVFVYLLEPVIGTPYDFTSLLRWIQLSFSSLIRLFFSSKKLFSFPISLSFGLFLNLGPLLQGSRASLKADKALSFQRAPIYSSLFCYGLDLLSFYLVYHLDLSLNWYPLKTQALHLPSLFSTHFINYQMREKMSKRKAQNNYEEESLYIRED